MDFNIPSIKISPEFKGFFSHASQGARTRLTQLQTTVSQCARKHLTPESLKQKAKNALRARFLPFSTRPDLQLMVTDSQKTIERMRSLKNKDTDALNDVTKQIDVIQARNKTPPQDLLDTKDRIASRIKQCDQNIQKHTQLLQHYKEEYVADVQSRMGGIAQTVVDAAVPGLGVAAKLVVTASATAKKELSAQNLPDTTVTKRARDTVRIGTLCTVACSVLWAATSYFKPNLRP